MPKKKQRKAGRVVKRKLADGTTKVYRYAAYKPKRRTIDPDSIESLIRAYRSSPEWNGLKPHTQQMYTTYLRSLEEVGQIPVKAMGRRELLIIRNGIAEGRGNGAGTGFMRAASAVFGWAVQNDWIPYSPVHKIKPLPGGTLPAWTRAEADQAQAALPEHLRRVVVLARYTGQRRGDLCAMTWGAFDGETIRLRQQKTGEALAIPCHPALRQELEAWRRDAVTGIGSAPILTNTLGRAWVPQHLSHELPTALKRIGISGRLNVHGLRKLAATELADAGCSTHEIAAITGHRTLAMVQHYTRTVDQHRLAKAAIVRLQTGTTSEKT